MSRIFLSHSSRDEADAVALKKWLTDKGWDDVFLDVDPQRGLVAGERWQDALKRAADRCEAVVFLVTPAWVVSKWCLAEFLLAKSLNKRIFGVITKPVGLEQLPLEMTSEWQVCHLVGEGTQTLVRVQHRDRDIEVAFLTEGLARLGRGLTAAGLTADHYPWPPENEPDRIPYRGLRSLDIADAAVFFGRDAQIIRGLDALRGMRANRVERLFAILGGSGSGKSSFMRAGLWPRLARDDRHFHPLPIIRPETRVLTGDQGFAAALVEARQTLGLPPGDAVQLDFKWWDNAQQPGDIMGTYLSGDAAPDVIVCVIDASQLERGLYLLFQTLQIGKPTLVALNMMDVAERRGTRIDIKELSRQLGGITVMPVVGSKGKGISELKHAVAHLIEQRTQINFDIYHPATLAIISRLEQLSSRIGLSRAEYLRVLFDVTGPAEQRYLSNAEATAKQTLDIGREELIGQFGSLTAAETASLTQTAAVIAAASSRQISTWQGRGNTRRPQEWAHGSH